MKKTRKRIVCLVVAIMLMVLNLPLSASAARYADTGFETPVTAGGLNLREKFAVNEAGIGNPYVKYELKLGEMQVFTLDGKTYGNTANVKNNTLTSGTAIAEVEFAAGTVVKDHPVTKAYTVEDAFITALNGLKFDAPGIYYWPIIKTVTTTSSKVTNHNISQSQTHGSALVVRVNDKTATGASTATSSGIVSLGLIATASINALDNAGKLDSSTKTSLFEDHYPAKPTTFTLKKEVGGTQGRRDQYFKFDVTISGLTGHGGSKLSIDTVNGNGIASETVTKYGEAFTPGSSNPTSVAIDTSGSATFTVWLKHQEVIIVEGIPDDVLTTAKWSVTESYNDGYTVKYSYEVDGTTTEVTGSAVATNKNFGTASGVRVVYTNERTNATPTGVILSLAPAIAIITIGGAGLLIMLASKKRKQQ